MTRLVHSERGYLRSMQISKCQIFAYVEGAIDRPFYERILQNVLGGVRNFQIVGAKELPGNTGGKPRIVEWFKSLKRKNSLITAVFGKKFTNLFFLDKDIDDATNRKLRSPHVLYTSTYDLEGHLISKGDFWRALADAAGITSRQAAEAIGSPESWTSSQVMNWVDWTALCMASQHRGINVGCTFDRNSAINLDLIGPVNPTLLEDFKSTMRLEYANTRFDFDKDFLRMREKVSRSIKSGRSLQYFKGKWFKSILQKHASVLLNFPDAQINSIGDRFILTLMTQAGNFNNCALCEEYKQPISNIVSMLEQI